MGLHRNQPTKSQLLRFSTRWRPRLEATGTWKHSEPTHPHLLSPDGSGATSKLQGSRTPFAPVTDQRHSLSTVLCSVPENLTAFLPTSELSDFENHQFRSAPPYLLMSTTDLFTCDIGHVSCAPYSSTESILRQGPGGVGAGLWTDITTAFGDGFTTSEVGDIIGVAFTGVEGAATFHLPTNRLGSRADLSLTTRILHGTGRSLRRNLWLFFRWW